MTGRDRYTNQTWTVSRDRADAEQARMDLAERDDDD